MKATSRRITDRTRGAGAPAREEARAVRAQKAEQDLVAQKQEAELEAKVKQIEVDKAQARSTPPRSDRRPGLAAPRDGVLVIDDHPWEGRKFYVGDTVQPGMTIMSLPDPAKGMQVLAELSDVDDGRVGVGDAGRAHSTRTRASQSRARSRS